MRRGRGANEYVCHAEVGLGDGVGGVREVYASGMAAERAYCCVGRGVSIHYIYWPRVSVVGRDVRLVEQVEGHFEGGGVELEPVEVLYFSHGARLCDGVAEVEECDVANGEAV